MAVTRQSSFDYNLVVDQLQDCQAFYFGYGTPNGSPDASYDDLFVYNRVLSATDVSALHTMANRVYDFNQMATGIETMNDEQLTTGNDDAVYDLQGRYVGMSLDGIGRGIYVFRGKKVLVK